MITRMSLASHFVLLSFFPYCLAWAQLPAAPPNPPPDDRYKADILLIVAHPDDDTLAAPYLAKAIYEEHKHVSVIYGTRGNAGVLATEAFDLAGDPVAFPEQVEEPRDRTTISNYGEGLHPWQPKKIYYFSDATHFEFLEGRGPQYKTSSVSPSKGVPYAKIASDAWMNDKSQLPANQADLKKYLDQYLNEPVRFVLGKSLVKGSTTGDVFEGITSGSIPYVRA